MHLFCMIYWKQTISSIQDLEQPNVITTPLSFLSILSNAFFVSSISIKNSHLATAWEFNLLTPSSAECALSSVTSLVVLLAVQYP